MHKVPDYDMDADEMSADFTKSFTITNREFLKARSALAKADAANYGQRFVIYCKHVIKQQKSNFLTIREAAYLIGNTKPDFTTHPATARLLDFASNLQRHPTNYKDSHKKGWADFVKALAKREAEVFQKTVKV